MTLRISDDKKAAQVRHLDLPGQLAAIFGLGTLIAVLIEGPTLGWNSPGILAGAAACAAAWIAFLTIESRRSEPMLPLSFFRKRLFSGSTIAAMTTALTNYGVIFMLSLYFQQVRGYSPLQTGLAFLPLTAIVTGANVVSGRWAKVHGPRWPVLVGIAITVVGFLGMLAAIPAAQYWRVGLPMIAIGLGAGLTIPAATAALIGTVERSRIGIAAGVLNSARQTGVALGVAIFGALVAMRHPFDVGMHSALLVAVTISTAALVWWFFATRDWGAE